MFLEDFDYDSESEFRKSKHAMSKYSKQTNGMQLPASLSCCVFFNMTVLSSVVTRTKQLILKAFLFFFSYQISSVFVNEPSFKTEEVISFQ